MNYKAKIAMIYSSVAVLCGGIVWASLTFNVRPQQAEGQLIEHAGGDRPEEWFPVEGDLELVNQAGEKVKISQLRGKVWVAAEFFSVCPKCATRNGQDLREIYQKFGSNPDFQIVCISVDPKEDTLERLAEYAETMGADAKNWWFLSGDEKDTHKFLREKMRFLDIRERTDPVQRAAEGRFAHDLGLMVINRGMVVAGKRDLAWAKEKNHELYEEFKAYLIKRIESELEKPKSSAAEPTSNEKAQ